MSRPITSSLQAVLARLAMRLLLQSSLPADLELALNRERFRPSARRLGI